jgi:hypothetical protein
MEVPVIEDLTSHDMPSNSPAVLVLLLQQPIVPQKLNVKVVHFEARVVDMKLWPLKEEETVVVNHLISAIKVTECCDISALVMN